jgi:hypothetical protein
MLSCTRMRSSMLSKLFILALIQATVDWIVGRDQEGHVKNLGHSPSRHMRGIGAAVFFVYRHMQMLRQCIMLSSHVNAGARI